MQAMSDVESSYAARTSDVRSAGSSGHGLPPLRLATARSQQPKDRVLQLLDDVPFTPTQGVRSPSPRSPTVRVVELILEHHVNGSEQVRLRRGDGGAC